MKNPVTPPVATVATTALIAIVLGGMGLPAVARSQELFPQAPGRDTLMLACTQCHSVGKMVVAELSKDDWQFIVYDMISRGAPVHQKDIADLTKYLQDNFSADEDE